MFPGVSCTPTLFKLSRNEKQGNNSQPQQKECSNSMVWSIGGGWEEQAILLRKLIRDSGRCTLFELTNSPVSRTIDLNTPKTKARPRDSISKPVSSGCFQMIPQRILGPGTYGFQRLQVGDVIRTETARVSADLIDSFSEMTGDTYALHMDDSAALA